MSLGRCQCRVGWALPSKNIPNKNPPKTFQNSRRGADTLRNDVCAQVWLHLCAAGNPDILHLRGLVEEAAACAPLPLPIEAFAITHPGAFHVADRGSFDDRAAHVIPE